MKKDLLELCLLQLLAGGDQYGYELLRRLHDAFPATQESAIYAILRGLSREGCADSYRGEGAGGPDRKYYRITDAGRERHQQLLAQWRALREALAAIGIVYHT